jgi:hypothetical protein
VSLAQPLCQLAPLCHFLLGINRLRFLHLRPFERQLLKLANEFPSLGINLLLLLRLQPLVFSLYRLDVLVIPIVFAAIALLEVLLRDEAREICVAACEVDLGRNDGVQPRLDYPPNACMWCSLR